MMILIPLKAKDIENLFRSIKRNFKDKLASNLQENASEIIGEQEEKIFESEQGSDGGDWESISPITLLARESEPDGAPYSSLEDVVTDAESAKPLDDMGQLINSMTDNPDVSKVGMNDRKVIYEHGTRQEGAKTQQEGGNASGLSPSDISRARERVEGDLYGYVNSFAGDDSGGNVPQREFAYHTNEGIRNLTLYVIGELAQAVDEESKEFS